MKLSIEWICDYVDLPPELPLREIMHDLTMSTVEVEGIEDPGRAFENVVVGQVIVAEPVGDSGLTLTSCDVGGQEQLKIVCSGAGIAPGIKTIVALPGARVRPEATGREVVVAPRETAGLWSGGLICRASDIGLGGVLLSQDVDAVVDLSDFTAAPGTPLAEAIGWHDTILDIDNKSLTNRPDLWCHQGIARELAAIYGLRVRSPDFAIPDWPRAELLGEIDPAVCHRFAAIRIEDAVIGPSPFWLRRRLARLGFQPINTLVDLTNYVMLDVGQPTHAYDSARLTMPLGVRRARAPETVALLDGKVQQLADVNIVVTDADLPTAAAGVMGGANSRITAATTAAVVEFANFNAVAIRRSAAALNTRTEASARYEKSIDTQRVDLGAARFAALLRQCQPKVRITGYDLRENASTEPSRITVAVDFLRSRLGIGIGVDEIVRNLGAIGFEVGVSSDVLNVTAPSWRSTGDVSIAHDLVEEVARLHGYENFAPTPLRVELHAPVTSRVRDVERSAKEVLASQGGMQEVFLYPWVGNRYLFAAGYDPTVGLRLAEPPGPNQATLQPSLVPGLLECIEANLRFENTFNVFACDDVYSTRRIALFEPGEMLPEQRRQIAGAFVGRDLQQLIRTARGVLDVLFREAHLEPYHTKLYVAEPWAAPGAHLGLTGEKGNIGSLAVISERVRNSVGLKRAEVVIFTLFVDALQASATRENPYRSPSVYQQTEKDFSMIFPLSVKWHDLIRSLDNIDTLVRNIDFVDAYRGKGIPETSQSITLRVTLGSNDRTLDSTEIEAASARIVQRLSEDYDGTLRG